MADETRNVAFRIFSDLNLLVAISRVERRVPDKSQGRREYAIEVREEYTSLTEELTFPYTADDVADLALDFRKQSTTKIKALIAEAHGMQCFWKHRGKGPCSDEVEAGHVVAASAGAELTVENGMIECRAHNNQRRANTIESYLLSALKTT